VRLQGGRLHRGWLRLRRSVWHVYGLDGRRYAIRGRPRHATDAGTVRHRHQPTRSVQHSPAGSKACIRSYSRQYTMYLPFSLVLYLSPPPTLLPPPHPVRLRSLPNHHVMTAFSHILLCACPTQLSYHRIASCACACPTRCTGKCRPRPSGAPSGR